MKNGNKPINPQIGSNTNNQHQLSEVYTDENNQGLTKKEHYAGLAMQALVSNHSLSNSDEYLAKRAVSIANELLKQLEIE